MDSAQKIVVKAATAIAIAVLFWSSSEIDAQSFADEVRLYDPGYSAGRRPAENHRPEAATGIPDAEFGGSFCTLGGGGRIELLFANSHISTDGRGGYDLFVTEVDADEPVELWVRPADAATRRYLLQKDRHLEANTAGFFFVGLFDLFNGRFAWDLDRVFRGFEPLALRFNAVMRVDVDPHADGATPGADIDGIEASYPLPPNHQINTSRASAVFAGVESTEFPNHVVIDGNSLPVLSLVVRGAPGSGFIVMSADFLTASNGLPYGKSGRLDLSPGSLRVIADGINKSTGTDLDQLAKIGDAGVAVIDFSVPEGIVERKNWGAVQVLVEDEDSPTGFRLTAATGVEFVPSRDDTVYAAPFGHDGDIGTASRPVRTITRAMRIAAELDYATVKLYAGRYFETPQFLEGISIVGGCTGPLFFDDGRGVSEIVVESEGVRIANLSAPAHYSGLLFRGPKGFSTQTGHSIAAHFENSINLSFDNCRFFALEGRPGRDGRHGTSVSERGPRGLGGAGSSSPGASGDDGRKGEQTANRAVEPPIPGGLGGRQGEGGDSASAPGTSGSDGKQGRNGVDGPIGKAPKGPSRNFTFESGQYRTTSGTVGGASGPGGGGGGGGGGGAGIGKKGIILAGGAAGHGGFGGQGSLGGEAGEGGGASFAVFLQTSEVVFRDCRFRTESGGNGGRGGDGASATAGDRGGLGAKGKSLLGVRGGTGGTGGTGGIGGASAGGSGASGGNSYCLFSARSRVDYDHLHNRFFPATKPAHAGDGGRHGDQKSASPRGIDGAVGILLR
jgi:hypothetical protein